MGSHKILVIEDDATTRAFLRASLNASGYEILEADSGLHVLCMIQVHAPDLIITDIFMDDQEGLETIMQIRDNQHVLPIIAISSSPQYLSTAIQMGADAAMRKPIDVTELLSKVTALISGKSSRDR